MKKELEQKLQEDFPHILDELDYGIECGDGWEPIIRNLCSVLKGLNRSNRSCRKKPVTIIGNLITNHASSIHRLVEKLFRKPKYSCNIFNSMFNIYIPFPGLKVKLTQIKEKFGTLRIYHTIENGFTEEEAKKYCPDALRMHRDYYYGYVCGAIDFAETQSELVCEKDGKPGALNREGWWKVMCADCLAPKDKPAENDAIVS
jgi:hypothetical protein